MGQNELILIGIFLAPIALLLLLRANATFAFLSLCLGYVLTQFLGGDIRSFAELFIAHANVSSSTFLLGLLLAPAVLTTVFMTHTVKGVKATLNILPAAAVGCLTVLLVVPLMPPGMSHTIMALPLWRQVARSESLAIGAGAVVSMAFLWMQRPSRGKEKKSSKRGAD
jgi:hypothetical protein